MDGTSLLMNSLLTLFYKNTDRFDKNSNILQVPELWALKGYSDSILTLDSYWETSQETVTCCKVEGFRGLKSWKSREDTTG